MSALIERLDASFTGPLVSDMPRIYWVDPIEAPGSLLLIDPMHPSKPWPAGVPPTGSFVPNLVWESAAKLTGATEETLQARYFNTFSAPTRGKAERTSKGALHGIVSPTAALTVNETVMLKVPDMIKNYWKANPTNEMYLSLWQKVTRVDVSGHVHVVSLISTNSVFGIGASAVDFMGGTKINQSSVGGWNVLGNALRSGSAKPGPNFATDTDTNLNANALAWNTGMRSSAANNTGFGSRIIYRMYLEDLTKSGRSYATVHALDNALYQKDLVAPGGRYYGDTHTDPTTVP